MLMISAASFSVSLEFQAHFNCMAWLFIFVLIAFILIFVEAGGYSKVGELMCYLQVFCYRQDKQHTLIFGLFFLESL